MPEPLLATKLYVPPPRPEAVPRPRLIEQLNSGLNRRLILVSAPAGFGKTTLLSAWVAGYRQPVAWVSLDKGDSDPARFWTYFVSALQTVRPRIGEAAIEVLQSPQPPAIESILVSLINEICGRPDPMVVVLDDYHMVESHAIHEALIFLLEHLPAQLHLVIASRADPPWPLAHWRSQGQLVEVRATDLRFEPEETADFLKRVMKLDLSTEHIAALEERTEGWIAGLQMAAFSLQGREDVHGFIQAFTGSNRFILDYLVEEVLQRQSASVQEFLLKTSILERLSAPLCDAVLGCAGSQAILGKLEKANLFLIPLDDERHWYRYHHLFGELLRSVLVATQADLVPVLHQRASRWFKDAGIPEEAIAHALESKDMDDVAHLIEQNAMQMMAQGRLGLLSSWMERLPVEVVRASPWLCVYRAWIQYYTGPRDRAEEHLRLAEQALRSMPGSSADEAQPTGHTDLTDAEKQHILGNVAAIRALCATSREEIPLFMDLAKQALELLPGTASMRVLPNIILGFAYHGMGDTTAAERVYRDARAIAQAGELRAFGVTATCYIGMHQTKQGRLHEAFETYCEALELSRGAGGKLLDIAGCPMAQLGDLLREWNQLGKADEYITQSVEMCERWGNVDFLARSYVALARLQLALGHVSRANDTIQRAHQVVRREKVDPYIACWLDEVRLRLWLSDGNLAAAVQWARTSGLSPEGELNYLHDLDHINLARVLLAQGVAQSSPAHLHDAQALLSRLLTAAQKAGWIHEEIKTLILQALLGQACNDGAMALKALSRALTRAEPAGYIRLFVDEGEPMKRLLLQASSRGITVEYASKLLAAVQAGEGTVFAAPPSSLVEQLSQRELEILRLLESSLSSPEIAERLCISVSTVRTHVKNIYRKLDVGRRMEAVERARELGLI